MPASSVVLLCYVVVFTYFDIDTNPSSHTAQWANIIEAKLWRVFSPDLGRFSAALLFSIAS